jgi:hypothetical protein
VETEISSLQKQLPKAQPQEIGNICVRYSRDARHRHKKQLQREGKERAMQASTCLAEEDARTSKAGKHSQVKAVNTQGLTPEHPTRLPIISVSGLRLTTKGPMLR